MQENAQQQKSDQMTILNLYNTLHVVMKHSSAAGYTEW
jgi:hypothetical protein